MNTHVEARLLEPQGADDLIRALQRNGYSVIAPALEDGAVVLREYGANETLPRGASDAQSGGSYRLSRRDDDSLFEYAAAPQGFKRHLWPPRQTLWQSELADGRMTIRPAELPAARLALFAARSCDIEALAVLDGVFDNGDFADPHYAARRRNAFIVAVECTRSAETCFCASMGSGPGREAGFDIALTELRDGAGHRLLARAGSERGAAILAEVSSRPASPADDDQRTARLADAAASQTRRMPPDAEDLLKGNREHPRWDAVAERCLSCGNCTMVCPTCFCTTMEDANALDLSTATRTRRWDSCFSVDFSYLHGGAVRPSVRSRYRQWITHKLAHWHDQFGRSGCVGCGRCITWCPVGIDIVEETTAIAASLAKGGQNG
ncbi:MAG: 4Fe-4S dicluster domain-containing protein [Hyphomicrobiales bacterium]